MVHADRRSDLKRGLVAADGPGPGLAAGSKFAQQGAPHGFHQAADAGKEGRFELKKHKLLFSFGTNAVKMCGFVEPAQRKGNRVAGISRKFCLIWP